MDMNFLKVYYDFLNTLEMMTDEDAGRYIKAILRYAVTGEKDTDVLESSVGYIYNFETSRIDRDKEYCQKISKKRAEAGRIGGLQKQANLANATFAKQNKQMLNLPSKSSNNNNSITDNDNSITDNNNNILNHICCSLKSVSAGQYPAILDFIDGIDEDLVRWAVNEACSQGINTWSYTKGILQNCLRQGNDTAAKAEAEKQKRESAKVTNIRDRVVSTTAVPANLPTTEEEIDWSDI